MTRARMGSAGIVRVEVLRRSAVNVVRQPSPAAEVRMPDGRVRWVPGEWLLDVSEVTPDLTTQT